MAISRLSIFLVLFILVGCYQVSRNTSSPLKVDGFEPIDIGYKKLKLISPLKRQKNESENCKNWFLSNSDASNILKKMKKVSFQDWYKLCYQYPCIYNGFVSDGKDTLEIEINAASYVILRGESPKSGYFILSDIDSNFVQPCNCCE